MFVSNPDTGVRSENCLLGKSVGLYKPFLMTVPVSFSSDETGKKKESSCVFITAEAVSL